MAKVGQIVDHKIELKPEKEASRKHKDQETSHSEQGTVLQVEEHRLEIKAKECKAMLELLHSTSTKMNQ